MASSDGQDAGNRRLLPNLVDEIASRKPDLVWAEYPKSLSTYAEGFLAVTYHQFANAVNGTAWWLRHTFGTPNDFPTLAYVGPNDVRYQLLLIGAIKAGFKVGISRLNWLQTCKMNSFAIRCSSLHPGTASKHTQACSSHPNAILCSLQTRNLPLLRLFFLLTRWKRLLFPLSMYYWAQSIKHFLTTRLTSSHMVIQSTSFTHLAQQVSRPLD